MLGGEGRGVVKRLEGLRNLLYYGPGMRRVFFLRVLPGLEQNKSGTWCNGRDRLKAIIYRSAFARVAGHRPIFAVLIVLSCSKFFRC